MPGKTDNLNILSSDNDNDHHNNNNHNHNIFNNSGMNPVDNGGNGVYTIHAMGGAGTNPDRYLSNESLETNSSGESNLGNIQHRKVGRPFFHWICTVSKRETDLFQTKIKLCQKSHINVSTILSWFFIFTKEH